MLKGRLPVNKREAASAAGVVLGRVARILDCRHAADIGQRRRHAEGRQGVEQAASNPLNKWGRSGPVCPLLFLCVSVVKLAGAEAEYGNRNNRG